jgi:tetratricopeptide (TPR) repeat protein
MTKFFSSASTAVAIGFLAAATLSAQTKLFPDPTLSRLQQGIAHIYSLEHDRAIEIFERMGREAPEDPTGDTYLAKAYWLKELVQKQELSIDRFASSDFFAETPKYRPVIEPQVEENFRAITDRAIEKAKARLDQIPNDKQAKFLLGVAYQNLASFEAALKRSWWSSFRAGSKSHRYHEELLEGDPQAYDAYLTSGVFNYVTGSLGWGTKWLALLFGYTGSKQRGIAQLKLASEKALLGSDDARVMLILIYTRERRFQQAFDELSILLKKYPKNYLVHLDMGGIALLMKNHAAAVSIYTDILQRVRQKQPGYTGIEEAMLFNRLGVAHRSKDDFKAAEEWFRKALAASSDSDLNSTVAHLELGKTYDLARRRQDATREYQAVLQSPDFAGSREEARELIEKPYHRR